jgi:hypothetical protein
MPNTDEVRIQESRQEVASLVREFYEEKSEEKAEELRARKRKDSPFLLVVAVIICGAAWVTPSFLPAPYPMVTQPELERSARLSLYLTSLEVRAYQQETGKTPAVLADARVRDLDVSYERLGDSAFRLSKNVGLQRISFSSSDDAGQFLGSDAIRLRIR